MTTLYQVLGVSPGASLIEIRDAYWEAARILHPDANPGNDTTDVFTDLANAWAILRDEKERARYDKRLEMTMSMCAKCKGSGFTYTTRNKKIACKACEGGGYHERKNAKPEPMLKPRVGGYSPTEPVQSVLHSERFRFHRTVRGSKDHSR